VAVDFCVLAHHKSRPITIPGIQSLRWKYHITYVHSYSQRAYSTSNFIGKICCRLVRVSNFNADVPWVPWFLVLISSKWEFLQPQNYILEFGRQFSGEKKTFPTFFRHPKIKGKGECLCHDETAWNEACYIINRRDLQDPWARCDGRRLCKTRTKWRRSYSWERGHRKPRRLSHRELSSAVCHRHRRFHRLPPGGASPSPTRLDNTPEFH